MPYAEGKVGPKIVGRGMIVEERFDTSGAQVITEGHARYLEAARNTGPGGIYSATTASGGVAPGTALASTAPIALYNPMNSGMYLSVLEGSMSYLSGSLTAMINYWVGAYNSGVVPGGTAIVPQPHLLGAGGVGGSGAKGLAYTSATGLVGFGVVRPHSVWGAVTAMATTSVQTPLRENVDGFFVLPPGAALSFQQVGGGGGLVVFSMTWEEVPIPS